MKTKSKFFAGVIAIVMAIGSIALVSCNKEQVSVMNPNDSLAIKSDSTGLPYFKDWNDLMAAMNTALSFDTITDLQAFEAEEGRTSIGAVSDAFYETIDTSKICNKEQAVELYLQNQNLLDTMMVYGSDIAIVPKMFHTPYRYVANVDGMFVVSTDVYKIFKSCIVSAPLNYANSLANLVEDDLGQVDTSIFHFMQGGQMESDDTHADCEMDWTVENNPTSSNNRIHIELITSTMRIPNMGYVADTRVKVYNLKKGLFAWWTTRHNLTCDADVTFHTKSEDCTSWNYDNYHVSKTQKRNVLWIAVTHTPCGWNCVNGWDILFNRFYKYHHYSDYTISASYPGHSVETLSKD